MAKKATKPVKSDPKVLKENEKLWHYFIKASKWMTIAIATALILLALILV